MSSSSGFPVDPLIEVGAFQQSDVLRRDPCGRRRRRREGEGKGSRRWSRAGGDVGDARADATERAGGSKAVRGAGGGSRRADETETTQIDGGGGDVVARLGFILGDRV